MEEDIKILEEMKNNCLNKRDYIDKKAERKAQAIENLINKNKEVSQKLLDNRNLFHENMYKAEKEIDRLRNKIANLEINVKEYERREKVGNENMIATLEESLKYCLQIQDLDIKNKELEKIVELMAKELSRKKGMIKKVCGKCNYEECIKLNFEECIIEHYKKKASEENG